MSRYRKVDVMMWDNKDFKDLSKVTASGQGLWFYLLTNCHTRSIPGLYRLSVGSVTDDLGWSADEVLDCFAEIASKNMASWDLESRVMWLPKAVKYNPPENPNVIKGWSKQFDEIPDCSLKYQAITALLEHCETLSEPFREALERVRQTLSKPYRIQEQEQEQEQEQDTTVEVENDHLQRSNDSQEKKTEAVIVIPVRDRNNGSGFQVTPSLAAEWKEAYPQVNVMNELRAARQWCLASPERQKTYRGVRRFLTNWLKRQQDKTPSLFNEHGSPKSDFIPPPYWRKAEQ